MNLVEKYIGEGRQLYVSAYWNGNTLVWRTEDGRQGSEPNMKKKSEKDLKKHLKKVLGFDINLELLKTVDGKPTRKYYG